MKALTKLHPDFYPQPGKQSVLPNGERIVNPIASGYLTKEDLLHLYQTCGRMLHRGDITQVLSHPAIVTPPEDVKMWLAKISTLLNHHQIQLIDPQRQFWVIMKAEHDGRVHIHEMKLVETLPIPPTG